MQKKILFLDLEDTIIERFDDPLLMNVEKIKDWLGQHQFDEIRMFSFAIHNDRDIYIFETQMRESIQRVLDITIHPTVFATGNHFKEIGKHFKESITHNELFEEIGKYRSFVAWCNLHFKGNHCVLLDDAFADETQILWDSNTQIDFVRIIPKKELRLIQSLLHK